MQWAMQSQEILGITLPLWYPSSDAKLRGQRGQRSLEAVNTELAPPEGGDAKDSAMAAGLWPVQHPHLVLSGTAAGLKNGNSASPQQNTAFS